MFCCTLLYVHSSIAIILMGKRELIALLNLSSWCLVMVERLFLAVPRGCLQFVIVVFPDHTHLLFFMIFRRKKDSILTSTFDILRFNGFHDIDVFFLMIKWSSDKVYVTVNKFGVHSWHVIRCFLLHLAVFCLANANKHLTSVFLQYLKSQFFQRKHVLMSLGLSYPVNSPATQTRRL